MAGCALSGLGALVTAKIRVTPQYGPLRSLSVPTVESEGEIQAANAGRTFAAHAKHSRCAPSARTFAFTLKQSARSAGYLPFQGHRSLRGCGAWKGKEGRQKKSGHHRGSVYYSVYVNVYL